MAAAASRLVRGGAAARCACSSPGGALHGAFSPAMFTGRGLRSVHVVRRSVACVVSCDGHVSCWDRIGVGCRALAACGHSGWSARRARRVTSRRATVNVLLCESQCSVWVIAVNCVCCGSACAVLRACHEVCWHALFVAALLTALSELCVRGCSPRSRPSTCTRDVARRDGASHTQPNWL